MGHVLAGQGLQLSYARDPSRREGFDPNSILRDLYREGTAHAMLPWQNGLRLAVSDHLVLATEKGTGEKGTGEKGTGEKAIGEKAIGEKGTGEKGIGRCLGVVAASDLATNREPFLLVDAAYIAPIANAALILHRMLAFAMLRIAGNEAVPSVIAARVRTPFHADMLRDFGRWFAGASLFPAAPIDVVIDLGMAALARRIGRTVRPGSPLVSANGTFHAAAPAYAGSAPAETLIVIDLSAANDASIIEDARRLYRARLPRGSRGGLPAPLVDTARSAASSLRDVSAV